MEKQYASFYLGDLLLGIDILMVNEINRQLDITPVDLAPPFVRGLLNLRGQIVTVLDLGIRFNIGYRPIGPESRCIILKTSAALAGRRRQGLLDDDTCADPVGLLIDRIGDMRALDTDDLDAPPANIGSVDGRYIAGVAQLDRELMITLRMREILSDL